MFLLDSLMISGIQWALKTVVAAAEAEMNDDSALRNRLLEAEMQREMGEISDAEFADIEADLLQAIREIKKRREGGSGAFAFGAQPIETGENSRFTVEAEVSGDFHAEQGASDDPARSDGSARSDRSRSEPVNARIEPTRAPRTANTTRTPGTARTRTARTARTTRTTGTIRTTRRTRTTRTTRTK